jgi:hypothetical protein
VSGYSTSHQLIELYHKICIALENGQIFNLSSTSGGLVDENIKELSSANNLTRL